MLGSFVLFFPSIKVKVQNLMFVLCSWHYFKLQFFNNYNLLCRVLPFLTQRMDAMERQFMIFRTLYLCETLGVTLNSNSVESNSCNVFPFSSSKCCPALPKAMAPTDAGAFAEPLYISEINICFRDLVRIFSLSRPKYAIRGIGVPR